mmetsp:Transcript_10829/g.12436  ORF Transcript_10829/g.12436 Transcript_10829/m.12436 type:complete len:161 (-) Transcript_10829:687-1169(-)
MSSAVAAGAADHVYVPSTPIKVLRWVNCVALSVLGAYSVIVSLQYFTDPTRVVLCIYLTLFGLLGIACELNLAMATRNFQFLMDHKGKVVYFIFIGTLGLSFGWYNSPVQKIIPFLLGIFSIFVAVSMILDQWCNKKGTTSDGGDSHMATVAATAGPNAI